MKLPVFGALATTFLFMARNWLDILKIVWLPAAATFAAYLLIMPEYVATVAQAPSGMSADMNEIFGRLLPTLPWMALLLLSTTAINLVAFTGLQKLAVRGEKPRTFFYIGFGADELNVAGGWAIVFGGFIALCAAVAAAIWLSQFLASLGPGPGGIIGLVAAVVAVCVGVWAGMRASFASPAAISERTIGVQASWDATEANVWRLIGFWLTLVAGMFLISSFLTPFLTSPGYLDAMRDVGAAAASRSPARVQAAAHHANEVLAAGYTWSDSGNVVRMLINSLLGTGAATLVAIANGVAWLKLNEDDNARTSA